MREPSRLVAGQHGVEVARLCRHFSELSPHPMVAVEGTTHNVRYLNDAFAHLVGKIPAELIGRPFAEAVPEGEANGCLALLDRVYRTGTPEILEEQEHYQTYNQTQPVYWSYSVWAMLGVDERPMGVMIQVTDATEVALFRRQVVEMNEHLLISATRQHELTEIAERANQSTEKAEQANAAKDEFLSRMSHELRTPLNAILGFGQLLELDESQLPPQDVENVQQILKAGRHLLDLINEVLDITRIQAPDSALSLEPVALGEVIHEALDMLQTLAAPAGISLTQQLEGTGIAGTPTSAASPIFVLADRQRLLQILLNLLANAIQYNKLGGRVMVSTEVVPENRVRFHVSDTGYGIAAEDLPKLFTPFSRLNAEHLGVKGTGLGLVLCQRLVAAMNGSIQIESQPGIGSTFSVELPLSLPPLPTQSATQSSDSIATLPGVGRPGVTDASIPLAKRTILLIEDNISNFQLIQKILEKHSDIRLVGAMQGSLGVKLALHEQPELILLDLNLPDIMGDEVLRRLQANPETQHIPVIVLSADALPSRISRLLAQGARQYLTKPLNVKQLLQAISETIHAP